jgi:hypothetical protein
MASMASQAGRIPVSPSSVAAGGGEREPLDPEIQMAVFGAPDFPRPNAGKILKTASQHPSWRLAPALL